MCTMPAHTHTNAALGVHKAPCQTQQQRQHAQNIRQGRKRTEREEEVEGVDGGNNTQHAPLCLAGLERRARAHGGIVAKWTADSVMLSLLSLGFPFFL